MTAILIVAAFAGASVIIALLFSWFFARLWCKPGRKKSAQCPTDFDLPSEDVVFSSHNAKLKGWFVSPPQSNSPRPTVVLVHGWSHNAGSMLPVARQLYQTGISALLFDVRGHGESSDDGPITMLKVAQDIIAAADYLKTRPDVDRNRIAVVGHSMGGSSTLLAASMEPSIRAVATSAAFADPVCLTQCTLRHFHVPRWPFFYLVSFFIERWLGQPMQSIAPVNCIGKIFSPLMLVHGEMDRFVAPGNLEELYNAANKKNTHTLLIPGRRHMDVIRDPQYTEKVTAFIQKVLFAPADTSGVLESAAG